MIDLGHRVRVRGPRARPGPVAVVLRSVGATLRGRDLAAAAATLTYFSVLAVVPSVLLAVWIASLASPGAVTRRLGELRLLVPPQMGALGPWDALIAAALHLGPLGGLVALFPATFYGEGIRRACLRLVPRRDRFTGWRARVTLLPLLVLAPIGVALMIWPSGVLADLARAGGTAPTLGRVFIVFNVVFFALLLVLVWVLRVVAPGAPGWPATLWGAGATAAVLAGFLQGFVLFLSFPIDLGVPFGGLWPVGAVVAVALWLFVLHLLFLVGWVATLVLDRRLGGDRSVGPLPTDAA